VAKKPADEKNHVTACGDMRTIIAKSVQAASCPEFREVTATPEAKGPAVKKNRKNVLAGYLPCLFLCSPFYRLRPASLAHPDRKKRPGTVNRRSGRTDGAARALLEQGKLPEMHHERTDRGLRHHR
jgi:hypothetical protein